MKRMIATIAAAVATSLSLGAHAGTSAPEFRHAYLYAESPVEATVGCLVAQSNPDEGLASCLCEATGDEFSFCATTTGTFEVHPVFGAAWGAALGIAADEMGVVMDLNRGGDKLPFTVDARGNCSLTQGSLELALESDSDRRSLRGILGARALYSAIYMIPMAQGYDREGGLVGSPRPIGDPVRLCGLGQIDAIAAGTIDRRGKDRWDGDKKKSYKKYGKKSPRDLTAALSLSNVGFTGGYLWGYDDTASFFTEGVDSVMVGVKYVVVAGVADAALRIGRGKRVDALGVLANTRLTDRAVEIKRIENEFDVIDMGDTAPPP